MTQNDLRGDKTTWVKGNYRIEWHCNYQAYFVYYKNELLCKKYKFSDVKMYL